MKHIKLQLLSACAVASVFAATAQAQVALPAADIKGAGASSITTVLVQSLNCVGNPGNHVAGDTANNRLNKAGKNDGTSSTVAPAKYNPSVPSTANPVYDCEVSEIQPNVEGHYVATGSGFGKQQWRLFTNQFDGTSGKVNPFGTWTNVQYAFSDSPIVASDITAYNANANNATNKAGPAIQVPLYVLPVAVAYNPKYGVHNTGSGPVDLNFNVKTTYVTKDAAGNPTGGLRLSKTAYCKIFNGEITNWNNATLKTLNGNQSLMSLSDSLTRWNADGVPIRLVGRLDKSGTTDIFTRHLAAVCDTYASTNKFDKASEALPFDPSSSIDLRPVRSDSPYFPGATASTFSGNIQSLSGAYFTTVVNGTEAAGLFMVADGSGKVRDAINFAPDKASASDANYVLNGKLGYIGADFVKPATGATLFSAALQQGTAATYLAPTAANAVKAFGAGTATILPPQTTATSGAYNTADARTNSVTGVTVDRANPLDWTDVLYSGTTRLDNPNLGYAITGTTQYLGYTCYATTAARFALVQFLSLNFGKVTKTSTGSPISANTFKGTGATALGILAQVGIAPLPGAWQNAIAETFLKKSTQNSGGTLGARNLWIQDKLPTTAAMVDGSITATDPKSNPVCTAGAGA